MRIPKNEFMEHGLLPTDLASEDVSSAPTIFHRGTSLAKARQRHALVIQESVKIAGSTFDEPGQFPVDLVRMKLSAAGMSHYGKFHLGTVVWRFVRFIVN